MSLSVRFMLASLAGISLCVGALPAQDARDLTTPAKRLIGHWALIPGDSTDFYFGPVDSVGFGPIVQVGRQPGATVRRRQYAVERQVPSGEEVALSVISEKGEVRSGADRIVVPKNGQTMTWTTSYETPIRMRAIVRLVYVDASAPPE